MALLTDRVAWVESVAPSESVTVRLEQEENSFTIFHSEKSSGSQLYPPGHSQCLDQNLSRTGRVPPPAPERVVPRNQVGEGEDGRVGRDLLLPQGTFDLLPVPGHDLVIVGALCAGEEEEEEGLGQRRGGWQRLS